MSFGGVALPAQSSSPSPSSTSSSSSSLSSSSSSSSSGVVVGGGMEERAPPFAPANPLSTPAPPVPPPNFSSNFTFQGGPPPPPPIPRPFGAAPSSNFSFPGPSPSPSQAPARLPYISQPAFSFHQNSTPGQIHGRAPTPQLPISGAQPTTLQNGPQVVNQASSQPPLSMEVSLGSATTTTTPTSSSLVQVSSSISGPSSNTASPVVVSGAGSSTVTAAEESQPLAQGFPSPTVSHLRPSTAPPMQPLPQGQQIALVPGVATSAVGGGLISARPLGPLPTPQYRAPFTANPAVSMIPPGGGFLHFSFMFICSL